MESFLEPDVFLEVDEEDSVKCNDGANKENSNDLINSAEIPTTNSGSTDGEIEETPTPIIVDCFKELENIEPSTIPDDFSLEELELQHRMFGDGQAGVQFQRVHCTACQEHLGTAPVNQNKRHLHPLLKVILCKICYDFYCSGDFEKDEDGSELYCRWCGEGGNVMCCAQCPYVFCKKCVWKNLGRKKLEEVKESDDWVCFVCAPEQLSNLRVTSRALYDYTLSELKIAKETNDPERLKKDLGLCCQRKPKPAATKRKRVSSPDFPYHPSIDMKKKYRPNSSLLKVKSNDIEINKKGEIWTSQEEDEVVCTPDVSLFMGDEESENWGTVSSETTPSPPTTPPPSSRTIPPPPLTPAPTILNSKFDEITVTKRVPTIKLGLKMYQKPQKVPPPPPLKSKVANTSPITPTIKFSNTVVGNGQSVVTVTHNLKKTSASARLMPGLKQDWFDRATHLSARVNQNLSTKLAVLAKEQCSATSLEQLASVHNKLQEILSNSINSLIQIRKNLRNDFLNGLNDLKFMTAPRPPPIEDDDVIFIDDKSPDTQDVVEKSPTEKTNRQQIKPFLKVRPISSLIASSSPIEIIEDKADEEDEEKVVAKEPEVSNIVIESEDENDKVNNDEKQINEGAKEEKEVEEKNEKESDDKDPQKPEEGEVDENLNPEVLDMIKKAIEESKLEQKLHETVNADIPTEELKRLMSVKVVLRRIPVEKVLAVLQARKEAKRKKEIEEAKRKSESQNVLQDIEQLLETNVVAKNVRVENPIERSLNEEEDIVGEAEEVEENDETEEEENRKWCNVNGTSKKESEESNDPHTVDSGIDVECDRIRRVVSRDEDDDEDGVSSTTPSNHNKTFGMSFASQVECDA